MTASELMVVAIGSALIVCGQIWYARLVRLGASDAAQDSATLVRLAGALTMLLGLVLAVLG